MGDSVWRRGLTGPRAQSRFSEKGRARSSQGSVDSRSRRIVGWKKAGLFRDDPSVHARFAGRQGAAPHQWKEHGISTGLVARRKVGHLRFVVQRTRTALENFRGWR